MKYLRNIIFPLIIALAAFLTARYTFNEKPDLNGDNINYYIYASSLASGGGYSDLAQIGAPPTSNFPPGYPLLMTPLRKVTDSIVAQKWQNEIFVILSLLLLYFALLRMGLPAIPAFVASFAGAFLPRLLHFSTMMMSEASFLLTSVCVIYTIVRMREDEQNWSAEFRHPWIYLMLVSLLFNYHIRTQGLALVAAVILYLLVSKRWAATGFTLAGFVIGILPWRIRNKMLGLNGNRYVDMIMVANPWRPEEGTLTISEFISRFFDTLQMLIFNAIPNTIVPFVNLDCDRPEYSFGLYLLGILIVAVMIAGCIKMGRTGWLWGFYFAATLGIISMFSSPSGNRYITTILPLLTAALFVGLWWICCLLIKVITRGKISAQEPVGSEAKIFTPSSLLALLLLPLLLLSRPGLQDENKAARQRYPLQYQQFFNIGKQLKKNTKENTVICSRKPAMLWMYAERPGCVYKFTTNAEELLIDLIQKKADFVILDALGYSSTPLYLFPAVQKYPQFFHIVQQYDNTHTYLLRFNREAAAEQLITHN